MIWLQFLLAAAFSASLPQNHIDPLVANRIEASYTIHCVNTVTRLEFQELFDASGRTASSDAHRVRLRSIAVEGRQISAPARAQIASVFGRFAWLERVSGMCNAYDDKVYVQLMGIDAEAWAAFLRGELGERPERRHATFSIAADGTVRNE